MGSWASGARKVTSGSLEWMLRSTFDPNPGAIWIILKSDWISCALRSQGIRWEGLVGGLVAIRILVGPGRAGRYSKINHFAG